MIVKPSINFLTKDSDAQLDQDVETIIGAMTGNAAYPTPKPALAAITTALKEFTDALAAAANGGSEQTAAKNAKRAELESLIRQLALYVAGACNGDLATLISSGFPIQKPTRSPVGVLPAPEHPFVKQGDMSGSLNANTFAVANAASYMWRIALASAPNTFLQLHPSTAAKYTFADLTPGQVYQVQVCALGAAGVSEWSVPGQRMVT